MTDLQNIHKRLLLLSADCEEIVVKHKDPHKSDSFKGCILKPI